jgi:hypothetical protein
MFNWTVFAWVWLVPVVALMLVQLLTVFIAFSDEAKIKIDGKTMLIEFLILSVSLGILCGG